LAEPKLVKAHVRQQAKRSSDAFMILKESDRITHGHFQNLVNGAAAKTYLEDVRLKAASLALRAAQIQVTEKLHLDLLKPSAPAQLALALGRVETKCTGAQPGGEPPDAPKTSRMAS
jgi:hypothetical protein